MLKIILRFSNYVASKAKLYASLLKTIFRIYKKLLNCFAWLSSTVACQKICPKDLIVEIFVNRNVSLKDDFEKLDLKRKTFINCCYITIELILKTFYEKGVIATVGKNL